MTRRILGSVVYVGAIEALTVGYHVPLWRFLVAGALFGIAKAIEDRS